VETGEASSRVRVAGIRHSLNRHSLQQVPLRRRRLGLVIEQHGFGRRARRPPGLASAILGHANPVSGEWLRLRTVSSVSALGDLARLGQGLALRRSILMVEVRQKRGLYSARAHSHFGGGERATYRMHWLRPAQSVSHFGRKVEGRSRRQALGPRFLKCGVKSDSKRADGRSDAVRLQTRGILKGVVPMRGRRFE